MAEAHAGEVKMRNGMEYRQRPMLVERDGVDAEDGGIPIAFSSEAPVLRTDYKTGERYLEVLDHRADSVDMEWARDGLPFLLEHDGPQIGILRAPGLGDDKKMRGMAYQGNHPDAEWAFKDIRGGIRTKVSVGYVVSSRYQEIKAANGQPSTRRFGWAPMEVSSVSIPADITVGAGRSAGDGGDSDEAPAVTMPRGGVVEGKRMADEGKPPEPGTIKVTDARREAIEAICIANGVSAAEQRTLLSGDKSPETIGREFASRREAAEKEIAERSKSTVDILGISKKENRGFSIVAATRGIVEKGAVQGFEREVSDALAKRYNGETGGFRFMVPMDMGYRVNGQYDTATTSQGTELKFIEPGALIELLRNRSWVEKLGARVIGGLQGNIAFPRQTAAQAGSWVGEGPTTALTLSAATLDQVSMSPKTFQAGTSISRQLLIQGVIGAEEFARADIAAVHALARDLAALSGTGANNQPTGILTNTNIGSVTIGTHGGAITYAKVVEMEKVLGTANADLGAIAYMTTPGVRSNLKTTQRFTSTDTPIWTGSADGGEVNGYRAVATNQAPSGLTKGTNTTVCHAIVMGNWNDLVLAQWGVMDIVVDPYTLADKNLIKLVSYQTFDVAPRHAASFVAIKDVLVS